MIIEINKDIDRYKETIVMGLTTKQLVFGVLSVAIGGGLIWILYPYIGLTFASYVVIPIIAPIALEGFYSQNGMSFSEVMKRKFLYLFQNRALVYESTEGETALKQFISGEKNVRKKKSMKLKKIKKGASK